MILETVFNMLFAMIKAIMGLVPSLPSLPAAAQEAIDYVFSAISGAMGIVGLFVDLNFVKIMIPVVLAIDNFDKIYKLVMFVARKIPFLGIE